MGMAAAKDALLSITDPDRAGFDGFPGAAAEVASRFSGVWSALVEDLASPPITGSVEPSRLAFQAAMAPLVSAPSGGPAALSAATLAAFPALAAAIAPNLLGAPPPAPFGPMVSASPTNSADGAAEAFVSSLAGWLASGMWTPPGPPAPVPFVVAP